jgi:hypothetical protein
MTTPQAVSEERLQEIRALTGGETIPHYEAAAMARELLALRSSGAVKVKPWYLGAQNDGLFIIDTPPRPSNDDQWHDRTDGPELVIPLSGVSKDVAQWIVDAHNAALSSIEPAEQYRDDLRAKGQEFLEAAEAVFDWMNGNDLSADHEEQRPDDFRRVSEALVAFRTALASPASPEAGKVTDAARDVLAERQRQVEAEGWTYEHDDDDEHGQGEMAKAAACYAWSGSGHHAFTALYSMDTRWFDTASIKRVWPWNMEWWKPSDRRRDLVKAGALILAEIERLDRAALTSEQSNG